MAGKDTESKLEDALLKVALGFQVAEVTEEFAEVDGELKLTKRKRIKKDVPPDLKAVQLLLSTDGGGYENWTDEELQAEKERLLAALQPVAETQAKKKKAGGRVATKAKKRAPTKKTVKKEKEIK